MRTWNHQVRWSLAALAALVASGCGDQTTNPPAPTVTATPDFSVPAAVGEINMVMGADFSFQGALFRQASFETSAGTGLVNPFIKTNTNDAVFNAFNTSGVKPSTVTTNDDTRDLPLSWVPTLTIDNVRYREFRLDINEPNNDERFLSLDVFKVYISDVPLVPTDGSNLPAFPAEANAQLVYDLDASGNSWLKMDATLSSGSGGGDVFFYIPETAFGAAGQACPYDGAVGAGCGKYLYLVVRFGDHYTQQGTFEEFAVRKFPYVTKTAAFTFDNNTAWAITKQVKRSTEGDGAYGASTSFDLWNGDNAEATYKVAVTKTVTQVNNRVTGQIVVHNPTSVAYSNVVVTDVFDGVNAVVTCPSANVPTGSKQNEGTLTCTYVVNLPGVPSLPQMNTATVTLPVSASLSLSLQGKANVAGPGQLGQSLGAPGTINVTDNLQGALGTTSTNQTYTYNRPFACAADKGTTNNTATIVETNQTANASVDVRCYSLDVTKTAVPAQGDVFDWTILKQVTPASRTMYNGDQGEFQYTVTYTKGAPVSTRTVSGVVTVANPAASSGNVSVAQPTDAIIAVGANAAIPVTLTCPGGAFPRVLAPGASFQCTYGPVALPNGDPRTNRASAQGTIPTNNSKTFNGDAAFGFAGVTPSTTNNAVSIADPNDAGTPRGPFTASGSFSYINTHACGTTRTINNTATMTSTDGLNKTSSASISITCVEPTVTKTAPTTFRRTWQWDITKSRGQINGQPAPSSLVLTAGQTFLYPYAVRVFTTGFADDQFSTSGVIQVTGNASVPGARSFTMTDAITGGFTPSVSCTGGNPQSITGAGPINCTWGPQALPDNSSRTNTATATLQNVKYQIVGGPTNLGTTGFTGTAAVTFGSTPTALRDNCVKVADVAQHKTSGGSALGSTITNQLTSDNFSICVSGSPGSADQTLNYTTNIGPMNQFASCGEFRFDNTATLTTNTTGTTDNSSVQTPISVACAPGCTLTQGYWKTHNPSFGIKPQGRKGPPIHDWSDAPAWSSWYLWQFFGGTPNPTPSGKLEVAIPVQAAPTWFTNFTTPPDGNPYYQASHQFMAALLNRANGASVPPNVDAALGEAWDFFINPANVPAVNWSDATSTQLVQWGGLFGSYNEGLIGPGHCSEDASSNQ